MSSDILVADASGLSPRAHIALLTLQLRAALREAEEAELAEEEWDADAATAHLRVRLQPLVDERGAALDDDLARARAEAAARIESVRAVLDEAPPRDQVRSAAPLDDDAHLLDLVEASYVVEVTAVVIDRPLIDRPLIDRPLIDRPRIDEVALVAVPTIVDVPSAFAAPVIALPVADRHQSTRPPMIGPSFAPPVADRTIADVEPIVPSGLRSAEHLNAAWGRPSTSAAPLTADDVRAIVAELLAETTARHTAPLPVATDPEAFSRAFASAFGAALGAALDERLVRLPYGAPLGTPRYVAPSPKRSFWANMWHADVMMSLLAAVIVLVVLIAWST